MEWLLGISVVFNVLFGLVVAGLIYGKVMVDNEVFHARAEWSKWELRFYEAQGMLIKDHNLFVPPTEGAYGQMLIKKLKES